MTVKWCVICSGHYKDPTIATLDGAINSVKELQHVILSQLGIPKENTVFIYDKTMSEILDTIEDFLEKVQKEDVVVFYFCGHGAKIGDTLWLFTTNTNKKHIELTALNYNNIINSFRRSSTKTIWAILDCCNSGAALTMSLDNAEQIKKEVVYNGEVILCSCSEIEQSIQTEIDKTKHCVFTYSFAEVLSNGSSEKKEFLSINDIVYLLKDKYENRSGRTLSIDKKQNLDTYGIIKNMEYTRQVVEENNEALERIRGKFEKRKQWRILLVKCSIKYPTRGIDFGIPLGLWVIKNYITLCKPNVQVDIYDERLLDKEKREQNYDTLVEEYDIIGVSMCSFEVPPALEKLQIAHDKGKITVVGGIFTYSNEKFLLKSECIDYVIPGVGTVPWVRLLDAIIVNHGTKNGDQVVSVNNVFSKNNLNTSVWITDTMPGIELHEWDEILKRYGFYITKKFIMA